MTRITFVATIIIMLFLGSVSVLAQETPQEEAQEEVTVIEACASVGQYAEAVFDARQRGVTLTQALGAINQDAEQNLVDLFTTIAIYIYEQPRYRTSTMVVQQKIDIVNEIEMYCITNVQ